MSNTIIRPTSREEWLEVRKSGIGSSEVSTIIGLNPWETPYQLWRRKVGLDAPKSETFAMKAGHYLEDAVSRFWSDETGREVIKRSAIDWIIRDNDRPYMQVSPDRTYWLGDSRSNDAKGILECKTTQMKVDEDDLPATWFTQVQYQLGVSGYEHGSLAWLCSGREFGYKDIDLVPDYFEWLCEEVDKFWTDNVLGKKEPAAINVADVMTKYYTHTNGKIIEVGQDIYDDCVSLKEVKNQIKELENAQDMLEEKIKLIFVDAEGISFNGQTLATWKSPKPSAKFDAKALQAAEPDTYSKYITQQQGARRFLLK